MHSSLSNGVNGTSTTAAPAGPPGSAQRAAQRRVPGLAPPTDEPETPKKGGKKKPVSAAAPIPDATPAAAVEAPLSPEDKKRRALKKKLDAIEGLKERKARGDALEQTQLGKIATEVRWGRIVLEADDPGQHQEGARGPRMTCRSCRSSSFGRPSSALPAAPHSPMYAS